MFVNLVPDDLMDDELYSRDSPLTAFGLRVVLEITERDSLDHVDGLPDRLRALRALGYRLAVDDLGAGYSGLTSVVALQPEVVKLDMALVRDIHKNDNQRRLVSSIATALQSEFKTQLVAEGIEIAEERDALCAMVAIDLLQGYFFGKPQRTPTAPDPDLIINKR
jgi:EAL domain-containing protein (putative c-di-GMP-specific phosphodiesterase class I)